MDRITHTIDFAAELTDLFDMRNKVVFMPGGYGGIGEAIAWALALAGAHVTLATKDGMPGKRRNSQERWPSTGLRRTESRWTRSRFHPSGTPSTA